MLGVRFGPTVDETVDIFSAKEQGAPLLVFIHGGYWFRCSSIFDLRPLRYSYLQPRLLLTHGVILRQSPCLNIPRSGPPLLITFGEEETAEFHRQSTEYLQAWRANGLRGELLVQEGKHHFSAIEGLDDANSTLCKALIGFMARCERI